MRQTLPDMGTRIVVVTDDDRTKGDALAEKLGRELYAMRRLTAMPMLDTEAGLDQAVAIRSANSQRPVVSSVSGSRQMRMSLVESMAFSP